MLTNKLFYRREVQHGNAAILHSSQLLHQRLYADRFEIVFCHGLQGERKRPEKRNFVIIDKRRFFLSASYGNFAAVG